MRGKIISAIISLFLFFIINPVFGQTYLNPPLKTDEDKISFLLYLNREMPDLFPQAINYPTDLWALFDNYQKVLSSFGNLPSFIKLKNKYNDRYVINVYQKKEGQRQGELESESSIKYIEVNDQIKNLVKKLKTLNSQNLYTGLLSAIQEDSKNSTHRFSFSEKIDYLKKHLPESLSNTDFRPEKIGISVEYTGHHFLSKNNLIQLLEKTYEEERLLIGWIRNQIEFNQNIEAKDVTLALAKELQMQEADLKGIISRYFPKDLKPLVANKLAHSMDSLITLEEVPVELALERGFPACDCSTGYSGLYAALPTERSFWIKRNNNSIGIVTGTILEVDGVMSFYLHTINGPNISVKDVSLIIIGINHWIKKNDLAYLYLPAESQLEGLVNREDLRISIRKYYKNTWPSRVQLSHIDKNMRVIIDGYYRHDYDRAEMNSVGVSVNQEMLNSDHFEVQIQEKQYLFEPNAKYTKEEIINLFYVLSKAKLTVSSEKLLRLYDLDQKKINEFFNELKNASALSTDEYIKGITLQAKKLGIDIKSGFWMTFFEKDISMGRLRSSDAFSEDLRSSNYKTLIGYLKNPGSEEYNLAITILKNKVPNLEQVVPFKNFMIRLVLGDDKSFELYNTILKSLSRLDLNEYLLSQIKYEGNSEKFIEYFNFFKNEKFKFLPPTNELKHKLSLLDALKTPIITAKLSLAVVNENIGSARLNDMRGSFIKKIENSYQLNSLSELSLGESELLFESLLKEKNIIFSINSKDLLILTQTFLPKGVEGDKILYSKLNELPNIQFKILLFNLYIDRLKSENRLTFQFIENIKSSTINNEIKIEAIKSYIDKVQTVNDFENLLDPRGSSDKSYIQSLERLKYQFVEKYVELGASLPTIVNLNKNANNGNDIARILEVTLSNSKSIQTVDDFLFLVSSKIHNNDYIDATGIFTKMWIKHADQFAQLKPNFSQIEKVVSTYPMYVTARIAIIKANLIHVKTERDFRKLMSISLRYYNTTYDFGYYYSDLKKLEKESTSLLERIRNNPESSSYFKKPLEIIWGKFKSALGSSKQTKTSVLLCSKLFN